jgi:hypothetical protein
MKKLFLFVIFVILVSSLLFCQDYDIRKLKWGMSFEEVKNSEKLGDDFFKTEELLGIKVEINFGFDYKGLYSVTYSTRSKDFAVKAGDVLRKKYGQPQTGLDYSFLMQSKQIMKQYPEAVVTMYEKGDKSLLASIRNGDERKLIRNALAKQDIWIYGNSMALLLNSPDVARLSYWSKSHQEESKKKFATFILEMKKKIKANKSKKKNDDTDKF